MSKFCLVLAALLAVSGASMGELTVTPDQTEIARPFAVRLKVTHAPGGRVEFPGALPLPEGARLLSVREEDPAVKEDGSVTRQVVYTVESLEVGKAHIGPVEYKVTAPDGKTETRKAGPVPFEIVTVRTGEDRDTARHIDQRQDRPLKLRNYLLPALLLLAVLLAAYLAIRWYRKRKPARVTPPSPPRPAGEIALEELARLREENPYGEGRHQEHFYRLSEILRAYIERRYGLMALERTTWELRAEFDDRYESETARAQLFRLLEACDLVKFANRKPSPANAADAIGHAEDWVRKTMRQPAAQTAAGTAGTAR